MIYKSIKQLNEDIKNNLYKIPNDVDVIVGVPRSGMLVANIISLYLNKPLTDIDSFSEKKILSMGKTKDTTKCITEFDKIKKVVVVEDSSDTGRSIENAKKKLEIYNEKIEILYFTMYVTRKSKKNVDIFCEIVEQPRVFEWNLMHNNLLGSACVDIDGVLCYDPTNEENDDGERYINFILNAVPKLVPTRKIKYIVTSRLEKYREYTKIWLKKNNIEYEELIMMNLNTAEERQKMGNHGTYKANVYKSKKDAILFIESESNQAEIISKVTGKDVVCIDETVFSQSGFNKFKYKIKNIGKKFLKKIGVKK